MLPSVIYIAGYGRSGSTLLDIMLGNHPRVVSTGELTYLFEDWDRPVRKCTCGVAYPECPVWGRVAVRLPVAPREAARVVRAVEQRSVKGWPPEGEQARHYRDITRALFTAAAESGAAYAVDSSKTPGPAARRPVALAKLAGLDVKVIHLVRSPLATWGSVRHGSNWAAEGNEEPVRRFRLLRAVPGWVLANQAARACRSALGPGRYLRVEYETLVAAPEQVLAGIGAFVGLDLSDVIARAVSGQPFQPGHNVGGNRLRLQGPVVLKRPAAR